MAETKPKKLKLFKFASEYNLSAKELLEFLTKKGYKVKTIMSTLEDDMIEEITNHFKKDIDKAQKHYKKIAEFKKEKTEKEEEKSSVETVEQVEDKKTEVEETK